VAKHVATARQALEEARSWEETVRVRNGADSIRFYCQRAGAMRELTNIWNEIRIDAERKAGHFLDNIAPHGGDRRSSSPRVGLKELEITDKQSRHWRTMSRLTDHRYESYKASVKSDNGELTTAGVVAYATELERSKKERKREQERLSNAEKVKEAAPVSTLSEAADQGLSWPTIAVDPPWDWGDEGDVNQMGRAKPDYATMPFEQIENLAVGEVAEKDAHIYVWSTGRSLRKAFALLDAWDFRYITTLVWVKPNFGMGNYFRGSTEFILFGVRGSLPLKRKDVGTHFTADRPGGHSAKPDAFYELVASCSPGPGLDIFGRRDLERLPEGWSSYGENGLVLP